MEVCFKKKKGEGNTKKNCQRLGKEKYFIYKDS